MPPPLYAGSTYRPAAFDDMGHSALARQLAFAFAVEEPEREIHLLSGHSFHRPLSSKRDTNKTARDDVAQALVLAVGEFARRISHPPRRLRWAA